VKKARKRTSKPTEKEASIWNKIVSIANFNQVPEGKSRKGIG